MGVVGFQEDDTNDVIANVAFTLKLLRIVGFMGKKGRDVKHDFDAPPVGKDGMLAGQIMNGVQASFVAIKSFQPDFFSQDLQKIFKQRGSCVVVKNVFFGVLIFFHINQSNFELGLDKNLDDIK